MTTQELIMLLSKFPPNTSVFMSFVAEEGEHAFIPNTVLETYGGAVVVMREAYFVSE